MKNLLFVLIPACQFFNVLKCTDVIYVRNKVDRVDSRLEQAAHFPGEVRFSSRDGEGLETLKDLICTRLGI